MGGVSERVTEQKSNLIFEQALISVSPGFSAREDGFASAFAQVSLVLAMRPLASPSLQRLAFCGHLNRQTLGKYMCKTCDMFCDIIRTPANKYASPVPPRQSSMRLMRW